MPQPQQIQVQITPGDGDGNLQIQIGSYGMAISPTFCQEISDEDRCHTVIASMAQFMGQNGFDTLTPEAIEAIQQQQFWW